jgi:hypothetical protein
LLRLTDCGNEFKSCHLVAATADFSHRFEDFIEMLVAIQVQVRQEDGPKSGSIR